MQWREHLPVDEVARLVQARRTAWPGVEILIRGDRGFCRDELMSWCEQNQVDFLFGLAKNNRLLRELKMERAIAHGLHQQRDGQPTRLFGDFTYQTLKGWSQARRVVGKAEHLSKGENPRFVITTLTGKQWSAKVLYEKEYCARSEMENRIKQQQLDLFADRTSTHPMYSNQLRLYFANFAYILMQALRRQALAGTEMEQARVGTIRLKLLKIGAHITLSVRRIRTALTQWYPWQVLYHQVWQNLDRIPVRV